jgi:hypothetical protein
LGLIASCLVCIAGCAGLTVQHDFDPAADFSDYRTFSWISDRPVLITNAQMNNPLVHEQIPRIVRDSLEARGYRFEENREEADFVLSFTLGSRQGLTVGHYPGPYARTWQMQQSPVYDEVRDYADSGLAIDIFDVGTRKPVWHGTGSRNVTGRDQSDIEALLRRIVNAILAKFPPP